MAQHKSALCIPYIKATLQLAAAIAIILASLYFCNVPATAYVSYEINDGTEQYQTSSDAVDLSEVLDTVGATTIDLDTVDSTVDDGVVNVSITRRQYVSVVCDGVTTSILAETQDTVADVLNHLKIELGEFDELSLDPDSTLRDVDVINVYRASVEYTTDVTALPYSTYREADPELDRGTETTIDGTDGSHAVTYRTVTVEGKDPVTEVVADVTTDPIPAVTYYGTKVEFERPTGYSTTSEYITNIDDEQSTFTTSEGNTYTFTGTMTVNATAYTARSGAICSTGRRAQVGVVAVDPKYIPYGTQMFIMSADGSFVYGLAVAGDCGSEIKKNDVDLFMTSRSNCINFGRHNLVAYMIAPEEG